MATIKAGKRANSGKLRANKGVNKTKTRIIFRDKPDSCKFQEKEIIENGIILPDDEYDGLSKVDVNVIPKLQEKVITENGSYTPDADYQGLSKVDVNISEDPYPDTVKLYGWRGQQINGHYCYYFTDTTNVACGDSILDVYGNRLDNMWISKAPNGYYGFTQGNSLKIYKDGELFDTAIRGPGLDMDVKCKNLYLYKMAHVVEPDKNEQGEIVFGISPKSSLKAGDVLICLSTRFEPDHPRLTINPIYIALDSRSIVTVGNNSNYPSLYKTLHFFENNIFKILNP